MSLSFSSSLLSSPLPRPETNSKNKSKPHPPNSILFPCAVAAAVPCSISDKKKQRHWKQGEYPVPGLSHDLIPRSSKKPPLRNLKKKLDRKNNAKAWVCTVTETLSDCILNKQWLQALQVTLFFIFDLWLCSTMSYNF